MRERTWSYLPVVNALAGAKAWACTLSLFFLLATLSAEPRWKIQFFYDHADSNFDIADLACPTTQHCIAAGVIDDKRGRQQGTVVVSSDSGQHWSQYEVKELPISLFFLNDSEGWMVTERGLWSTVEGGRSWSKVTSRKGILQAWFLDAMHGYIAGLRGLAQETTDGGKSWVALEESAKAADAQRINYQLILFEGARGFIIGSTDPSAPVLANANGSSPPKGQARLLETLDGGKKWTSGTIAIDGALGRLRMSSKGFLVSLMVYSDPKAPVTSAVFQTPLGSPNGSLIFAQRNRSATDVVLLNNGGAVLAAVEPPGTTPQVPIPGKLKVLRSDNLKVWHEMDVDYRAVAQRAVIAAPDDEHIWVATDTGQILGLID